MGEVKGAGGFHLKSPWAIPYFREEDGGKIGKGKTSP